MTRCVDDGRDDETSGGYGVQCSSCPHTQDDYDAEAEDVDEEDAADGGHDEL